MRNAEQQPNIVLIQCDSMDGRRLGCMGDPAAYTPNLDKLAAQGVLFRNAYCNSPQCAPSRASMWSGLHTHHAGAWNNFQALSPEDDTFLTWLEAGGYTTQIYGKTDHLAGSHSYKARVTAWTRSANIRLPQKKRYSATVVPGNVERVFEDDWNVTEQGVQWLNAHSRRDDGRPFFLHLSLYIPHPAYRTSQLWLDKIDRSRIGIPPYEAELHPVMEYMSIAKSCLENIDEAEIVAARHIYRAMIAETDAMVGCVAETIANSRLSENTYVIFTSDHGDMNMEHRQLMKNAMYEASARVPLIIAGPGVRREAAVSDPVSLVDLFPTLMDMASVSCGRRLDGESLMPQLAGASPRSGEGVLAQYHSSFQNTSSFMLRTGPWKYIAYPGFGPQLFHLGDDPDELHNLAAARPDVAARLDRELRERIDYPAVDAQVKGSDKASLREWRDSVGEAEYRAVMGKCYAGFGEAEEAIIRDWLHA